MDKMRYGILTNIMHTYEYPRPAVTVDIVLFAEKSADREVLLIQRKNPPFKDQWAFPGGFIEMDESLEESAQRELREETGLSGIQLAQVGAFGDPDRDPRGRVVTVAYYGLIDRQKAQVIAASDAADARWFSLADLPPLAFDHARILAATVQKIDSPCPLVQS
ncbi:MAG: NUDIX hydrolase [Candidatus Poribacteria bacterium]|nr:NUDIX hydrolase [Candidatus Poribacteria bacterium]